MSMGMYGERARLYDLIYSEKDYAAEAALLCSILSEHGVRSGDSILEAACGTGNYLEPLAEHYEVTGFDISPDMLELGRSKLPNADFFEADMFAFEADRPYDAVLCLFSSLSYAESLKQLEQAAQNFHESLRTGGVLIVEPWLSPGEAAPGRPSMKTYEDENIKIARQFVSRSEGRRAVLDFHWLVAERDGAVDYFTSQVVAYLYTTGEYQQAIESAGFDVTYNAKGLTGRGLFVAVSI
jgi:daunosaminyl-N,N-dimethyltransferase/N-dimethyltransferase